MRLMGKSLVAAFFLLAFFFQTFHKSFIVADYYANTSSYEVNCENKARPELQCHGKCQVVKQLAAEEKKDQQNPERRSENRSELICQASVFDEIKQPCFDITFLAKFRSLASGKLADQSFDFFQPPRA